MIHMVMVAAAAAAAGMRFVVPIHKSVPFCFSSSHALSHAHAHVLPFMAAGLSLLEGIDSREADLVAQDRGRLLIMGAELGRRMAVRADGDDLAAQVLVELQDIARGLRIGQMVAPARCIDLDALAVGDGQLEDGRHLVADLGERIDPGRCVRRTMRSRCARML